jgi:Yip1 domain
MSTDNDEGPQPSGRRFNMDDARGRAREALRKSEFILSRAWGLLSNPKGEWEQIRDEETTIPNILIGYVAPLAAIPPVCDLIGSTLFNRMLQIDPGEALVRAVVTWLVSIALVGFLGVLINVAADNFDAEKNDLAAQKVAAYALTPSFLSGVFSLWPPLWWLSLFALAAMVFLMFRGLPILMKAPEENALNYAATMTVASVVAFVVLFSVAGAVA